MSRWGRAIRSFVLKERRKLDIIKGFTTKGIHRDDFMIYINKKELDIYGSQGQHRTAILSLKLSELNIIYDEIGEYPILLLDDFMSELDDKRRKNFLNNIISRIPHSFVKFIINLSCIIYFLDTILSCVRYINI